MPLIIPRMFSFLFRFKSNSCEQRLIDNIEKHMLIIQDINLNLVFPFPRMHSSVKIF